ncbi:MAG: DUF2764 family protein [Candidatus Delongbacteria bacterium]
MFRKYYCLVSGLPNISLEDSKLSYGSEDFLHDMKEFIHEQDFKLFRLFRYSVDNYNIYRLMADHDHEFVKGGNYDMDEIDEILEDPVKAEDYIQKFIEEFRSEEFSEEADEKRLRTLYYSYLINIKNDFLKKWFELELNLKNIFAALNARKFSSEVEKEVVNANEVSEALISSSSRDFGLTGDLEYIEQAVTLFETEGLKKREKAIDQFKWEWLNTETFFEYFTVEKLISYFIKLRIIERWVKLDPVTGKEFFENFIKELEQTYKVPEEFENV